MRRNNKTFIDLLNESASHKSHGYRKKIVNESINRKLRSKYGRRSLSEGIGDFLDDDIDDWEINDDKEWISDKLAIVETDNGKFNIFYDGKGMYFKNDFDSINVCKNRDNCIICENEEGFYIYVVLEDRPRKGMDKLEPLISDTPYDSVIDCGDYLYFVDDVTLKRYSMYNDEIVDDYETDLIRRMLDIKEQKLNLELVNDDDDDETYFKINGRLCLRNDHGLFSLISK